MYEIRAVAEGYATAMAALDLSHICKLCCRLQQHWILNSLNEARDRTGILMETTSGPQPAEPQWELRRWEFYVFFSAISQWWWWGKWWWWYVYTHTHTHTHTHTYILNICWVNKWMIIFSLIQNFRVAIPTPVLQIRKFFFLSFVFLGLHPWHMELSRLGVESEL